MVICEHCGREFKSTQALKLHLRYVSGARKSWNKGLTAVNNESIARGNEKLRARYASGELFPTGFASKDFIGSKSHRESSRRGGIESALSQQKRSKNEIYFANLCISHFNAVKCNEKIFNGWDSDVIVEDIRVAIQWNGQWHYKNCGKNHKLEQVQSRDKIKIHEIEKCGYTPYTIKDMGKYNTKFVEEQFAIFLAWCNGSTAVL